MFQVVMREPPFRGQPYVLHCEIGPGLELINLFRMVDARVSMAVLHQDDYDARAPRDRETRVRARSRLKLPSRNLWKNSYT